MDMQIDAGKIRKERERRAWSQEHLAKVAALSLRTVQRVEGTGAASFETARALAAVFEVEVASLAVAMEPQIRGVRPRPTWIAVSASLVAGVMGLFIAQVVRADQVMLDVDLMLNERPLGQNRMVVTEGKDALIRLEGQMRIAITPVITKDGAVLLSLRVDEFSKSDWTRVGEPKLMANDDDEATVSITSASGNVIRVGIRPHKVGKGG